MKFAIIGGGFSGLGAAVEMRQRGHDVTLFEKNKNLGGLAGGFRCEMWQWSVEHFYHHWFTSDQDLVRFLKELNLIDKFIKKSPVSGMQTSHLQFCQLDGAMALLKYPGLKIADKLRMGAALAYLQVTKSWQKLEKYTAAEWCSRHMGPAGFSEIWKPLLQGKFGKHWQEVNMAWLWARIHSRTPQLCTYQNGFMQCVEDVEAWLVKHGTTIVKEVTVSEVTTSGHVTFDTKQSKNLCEHFDGILFACPWITARQILKAENVSDAKLPYLGAVVALFSLKRPLNHSLGLYWYSLRKSESQPFLAVIDHSRFIDAKFFANEHLVYVADYREIESQEWQEPEATLLQKAFCTLKNIDKSLEWSDINRHWVFKEPYAQPVPYCNASQNLPPLVLKQGPCPILNVSLHHIYPWDRGTNYAIKSGREAAIALIQNSKNSDPL